jgi:flagellar biosynthetic protein FlhB
MQDGEDPSAKSEQATPFKLERARHKGMVARSMELGGVAVAAASLAYLWGYGADLAWGLALRLRHAIEVSGSIGGTGAALLPWIGLYSVDLLSLVWPWLLISAGAALVVTVLQTGPVFAPSALTPDFTRLNPVEGLKRLFTVQTLAEAAKSSAKLLVYGLVTTYVIGAAVRSLAGAAGGVRGVSIAFVEVGAAWMMSFVVCAMIFGTIDLQLVRRRFAKRMQMSRRDLRDEQRNREGEPRIKQRRRQIARELLKRGRSLRRVRDADLLVTNPTHVAVALRYDAPTMIAPLVVARGVGDFALRMRRVAFVYGVPCFESPALARELYRQLHLDQPLPQHLYRPVADLYRHIRRAGATPTASA